MLPVSRDRDRLGFERQLHTREGAALFREIRFRAAFIRHFRGWDDLIEYMRTGRRRDRMRDRVLRAIFEVRTENRGEAWISALAVIFWPGLQLMQRRARSWDRDSAALWQALITNFFWSVRSIDVTQRPRRFATKVMGDTWHRLYDDYRRGWARGNRERSTDPDKLARRAEGADAAEIQAVDDDRRTQQVIARLRDQVTRQVIAESDFFVILATRVYGVPLREYAESHGISYVTLRKRRFRAEQAIRNAGRENF